MVAQAAQNMEQAEELSPKPNPLPPIPTTPPEAVTSNALAVVPTVKPLGGYMFKQGPKDNVMKRRWHKRWFFQRNMKLFYYKAKGDDIEKGFIDMELCRNIVTIDTAYVIEVSWRADHRRLRFAFVAWSLTS